HDRCEYPQRDSNPCRRRERPVSWASRRWGPRAENCPTESIPTRADRRLRRLRRCGVRDTPAALRCRPDDHRATAAGRAVGAGLCGAGLRVTAAARPPMVRWRPDQDQPRGRRGGGRRRTGLAATGGRTRHRRSDRREPRDGPWGRGCGEPGCASQPQPGRPWFDGVMIRISREDFEEAVDDALDSLPEEIARAIAEANVAILVEEDPAPEQSGGTELLGLYEGIPLDKRSIFQGYAQPDRIFIFRGPLQRHARSREHLVEEIAVTVLHELGHLFGISDARLHELGWG